MTSTFTVNVWFGAQNYAEVSETFASREAAEYFAASYTIEKYPDASVRVFEVVKFSALLRESKESGLISDEDTPRPIDEEEEQVLVDLAGDREIDWTA